MKTRRRLTTILAALLFSMLLVESIFAQEDPGGPPAPDTVQAEPSAPPPGTAPPDSGPGQTSNDPPGRVARIQYMSGEVSMQPGGVNEWVAASQNRPLTTSDRVWTDKNSKTELSVGDAFLRMNSETSVTLSNVSDNTVQVELDQGTLELTVRHLEGGEIFEVDTPNAAFTVTKNGVYRFDVFPNEDQTWITVRKGQGQATGRGNAVKINSGQQVRFSSGTSLVHTAESAPNNDGFDDWAKVRDDRLDHSESARYVSPGVIGVQDLDQYGRWQTTPQYGAIWVPTSVPAGWAPYRNGHWAWIDPWGWTWVDDAPWGFAPFHYGRWVSYGGYWGWAPGPIGFGRPYYAPALVGWVGGPGFGVGFGGAGWGVGVNFGWFALGFGEPFYPWYGGWGWGHGGWYRAGFGGFCSRGYFNRVNVTNTHITNITNITNNYYSNNIRNTRYVNRNINGAVTAAPKSAFTSGAPINRAGMAVPQSALRNAQAVRTANVNPTREAMLGGRAASNYVPPRGAVNRPVVTNAPPPARQPGFGATQANGGSRGNGNNNGDVALRGPNTQPARGPQNAQQPTAAHNVPRPPSAGGTTSATSVQPNAGAQPHNNIAYPHNGNQETRTAATPRPSNNVPRPPSAGDTAVRGNGAVNSQTVNSQGVNSQNHVPTNEGARPVTASPGANRGNQDTNMANRNNNVPRPPATYTYSQPNHAVNGAAAQPSHPATYQQQGPSQRPAAPPQQASPQHQAAPVMSAPHSSGPTMQSAPAQHQSAPSHESGQSKSEHPGSASMSVPRPPSGYSYRAGQTYSAATTYGSNRGSSYAGSSYARNAGYATGGYSAGSANRSYSATPSYGASRSYSSSPTYSGRSAAPSSFSAPRSYGGGGGRPSTSGGGIHMSSGGGGGGHRGK